MLDRDTNLDKGLSVLSFPAEVVCGKVLLVGGQWKGQVSCIDIETGQEVFSVRPSGHTVTVIKADNDSNQVAMGDSSGQVTLFRVNSTSRPLLEMRFRVNTNTAPITDINISVNMKVFSVSSSDCSVVVYNYITCEPVSSLRME